jgi:hypothetical protein
MAVFWVTFRIKEVGDYGQRYEALKQAIIAVKADAKWWVEPTSFFLFRSQFNIDQIAARIKGALDLKVDLVLISTTEAQAARVVGKLEDPDLYVFMPYAKPA